jgi:hypothetical protein
VLRALFPENTLPPSDGALPANSTELSALFANAPCPMIATEAGIVTDEIELAKNA